jgi:hypothetical protein
MFSFLFSSLEKPMRRFLKAAIFAIATIFVFAAPNGSASAAPVYKFEKSAEARALGALKIYGYCCRGCCGCRPCGGAYPHAYPRPRSCRYWHHRCLESWGPYDYPSYVGCMRYEGCPPLY